MSNLPSILIELTPEQDAAIEPYRDKLAEWEKEGKAGILAAQIYRGKMVVGTINPDNARKMCEATNSPLHVHRLPEERYQLSPDPAAPPTRAERMR